jgi:hypothetical protein
MIGKLVSENQDDWDLILPHVMSCYRATSHESTGFTPNMLMLGREVRAPLDIALAEPLDNDPISFDLYVDSLQDRLEKAYELTRRELKKSAEINKRKYDVRVKPLEYKSGDQVWLFQTKRKRGIQDKWARKYEGPYTVLKTMGPVNLLVSRGPRKRPMCIHVDKVKPITTLESEELDQDNPLASTSIELSQYPQHRENSFSEIENDSEILASEQASQNVHSEDIFIDSLNLQKNERPRRTRKSPNYLSDYK